VVDDALEPRPPHLDDGAVRQDRRVLHRDRPLVVEAVRDPPAHLVRRQPSVVHAPVERVAVVVAGPADRLKGGAELVAAPAPAFSVRVAFVAHNSNSMPSYPTSAPAASTAIRSAESSSSIGLVLLTWTYTVRRAPSARTRARLPPAPPTGRWPIAAAENRPAP